MKLLILFLFIDFIIMIYANHFFPTSGKIMSEIIILLKIPGTSHQMKLRKQFGFTGWFYWFDDRGGGPSISGDILLHHHASEIMNHSKEYSKAHPYGPNVIDTDTADFLSQECREDISVLYYATHGKHGARLVDITHLI